MSLKDVNPEHRFVTRDGVMLANLFDLSLELSDMSDATFMHHVNDSKNDFHNWVHHIVQDKKLAEQLAKLKGKDEMMKAVQSRILELQREAFDEEKALESNRVFSHHHLMAGLFIAMIVGLILLRALVF
jgi:hypothetical protein